MAAPATNATNHPIHHNHNTYTTPVQKIFIIAVTAAAVALTVFATLALGIPSAIILGGLTGFSIFMTVGEFFRSRMVKLGLTGQSTHTNWSLFPKNFFAVGSQPIHKTHKKKVSRVHLSAPKISII